MRTTRRSFVAGAVAACVMGGSPAFAASGTRRFDIRRAETSIGDNRVSVSRNGAQVSVDIAVDIEVRALGLRVYRYSLASRELWEGGQLMTLESESDDNGKRHFVSARRGADGLRINGSGFSGTVGGNPGTTTYWSPALLSRSVWISTQGGKPLSVRAQRGALESIPTATGTAQARRWRISGDLSDLDLFYDASDEWVGSEFPARGEVARFTVASRGPALTPLWVGG